MSALSCRLENGRLFIGNGSIDLPYPVSEIIDFGDSIAVRVEPPVGVIFNRNVFAFSERGDPLWQIEESPHGTENDKPYVKIIRERDGGLVAYNWNGVDYLVDMANGAITTKAVSK